MQTGERGASDRVGVGDEPGGSDRPPHILTLAGAAGAVLGEWLLSHSMMCHLWGGGEMIAGESDEPRRYLGVMVSSTFRDLREHRAALMRAIERQGLHAVGMEQDAALPDGTVVDASLQKVRDASAYVGVVSHVYGQIPEFDGNPERLSLTELEFREARRLGRPALIFIMGSDHQVTVAAVEQDPERRRKLDAFREAVKRSATNSPVHRVYCEFNDLAEFSSAATQSVAELRRHLDAHSTPAASVASDKAPDPSEQDGIPVPPRLYAEPPYIGSHQFVGRLAQLTTLDDWSAPADPHPVLLVEAIGGTGKSMLTWEWTTHRASGVRGDWAGRFWYSFYEKGAVMADFCRRALAYMTGRPVADFADKKQAELSDLLLRQIQARPWLLVLDGLERVLVAYHRADAAQLADEQAGRSDEIAHRDPCAAIRPLDDDLLRSLAGAAPSKVLITSRLVPRVLLNSAAQPIPGVLHQRLPGLRPAEAEALLRACGVQGEPGRIRAYLQRHCDCHPLVTGIVAGLVIHYLPARGQFDTWASDPGHGGRLDLAELDLVQKRNHILHSALDALPDTSRRLLSTLALLSGEADYETLSALNPHLPPEPDAVLPPLRPEDGLYLEYLSEDERRLVRQQYLLEAEQHAEYQLAYRAWQASPEFAAAGHNLSLTVADLEKRGLLQYDRQAGRYDLHPVVRGIAAGALRAEDREHLGQRVVDHFSSRPHNPYEDAESLDDLSDAMTVIRTLQRMDRMQKACDAYRQQLGSALVFNLEAYAEELSLLRPFFTHSWALPSTDLLDDQSIAVLANDAGAALSRLGELDQALTALGFALKVALAQRNYKSVRVKVSNLAGVLVLQNRLALNERYSRLSLELAELLEDPEEIFIARFSMFKSLAIVGRAAEAERMWQLLDPMGRDWHRSIYRPGDAERSRAQFKFERGTLVEDDLVRAEQLASTGRNRRVVRMLHKLRGEWLLQRSEWARAANSFDEAVRMAREAGIGNSTAETWLALARLRLDQLPDPPKEAERLTAVRKPAHLPLANLWQDIGNIERATEHALAAYRHAWADGEPHVHRHELERAASLLKSLGVDTPVLPAYDPATAPPAPWEDKIVAAIEELRAENQAEL